MRMRWLARRLARFRSPRHRSAATRAPYDPVRDSRPVLLVVEGQNDIEFLRRISRILQCDDARLPNVSDLERRSELVLIPSGGGDPRGWAGRLAPLGCPELHLFDRETGHETAIRQEAVAMANLRPECVARLTLKRNLENYLHPQAIAAVSDIQIEIDDDCHVADRVAQAVHERSCCSLLWHELPHRRQKRYRERAKRWLNTRAVERMTPQLLSERDPQGEVRSWLWAIRELHGRGVAWSRHT